jgi:protein phosphatase 2C
VPAFVQQQPLRRQQSSHAVPEVAAAATAGEGSQQHRGNCFASNDCPSHGMVSLCGRRREMEDAVVSQDSFVFLPCSEAGGCDAEGLDVAPLHYFGVYDGHGGSQAANFCAQRLHKTLAEEVETHFVQGHNNNSSNSEQVEQNSSKSLDWEAKWLAAMTQCFKRMDAEVGGFSLEDEGECTANDNPRCCPEPIAPETVGTTAIVAVVGACQIIVGNCGDSRAVLSRGGVAIPLSVDHKPEREDEMARVEAAGGRVIYWNGHRVLGVLAMSRAIGDRYLKPYVIADPEVKCIKRAEDDECLILASDGLWDVMSNEVVCDVARRALNCKRNNSGNSNNNGQSSSSSGGTEGTSTNEEESPAAQAAALLVKLALAKGSSDNISVVVVDLMKAHR